MPAEYPLEQLKAVKKKRLENAEKALVEKKAILSQEKQKLLLLQQKRDQVNQHYQEKLAQLRENLDQGAAAYKIQQIKDYLKIVAEELKEEEKKVKVQEKNVEQAEHNVDLALKEFFRCQKDIEKLSLHQEEWKKEIKHIEQNQENIENDEIGNVRHIRKKHKKPSK